MAVKMRLMRMGKKKSAYYRVVVMDGRAPRDGRYIDLLGRYDPNQEPSLIDIDNDKAVDWLKKGAQPTETVAKLLSVSGAMTQFKVATGRVHVATPQATAPVAEEPVVEEAVAEEPSSDEVEADAVDAASEEE